MSIKKIQIHCPTCSRVFLRTQKQINVVLKRSGRWKCKGCVLRLRNAQNARPVGATRPTAKGYVMEKTAGGWFMQHVVVMEQVLGRKIKANVEAVHHINEIKTDNRISNLEVKRFGDHTRDHHLGTKRSEEARANIKPLSERRNHMSLNAS